MKKIIQIIYCFSSIIFLLFLSACEINYPDDIQRAIDNVETSIDQKYDMDNMDSTAAGMQVLLGGFTDREVIYIIVDQIRDEGADVGFSIEDNLIVTFLAQGVSKDEAVSASIALSLMATMMGNEELNIVVICEEYGGYYYNMEWNEF
ncbi:conserved domain protein [Turicibacter sp. HGF1]|uniref:hypothetical protein n=1 Tax=Turicibacter sp. HGF1 TaxID=910310 RepID=UPI0001FD9A0D|nr:hypothetical protein [Turicibacter sp. HGF1]EGC92631.1 conserved domain protein [Turicibacter sp. HGF1]